MCSTAFKRYLLCWNLDVFAAFRQELLSGMAFCKVPSFTHLVRYRILSCNSFTAGLQRGAVELDTGEARGLRSGAIAFAIVTAMDLMEAYKITAPRSLRLEI